MASTPTRWRERRLAQWGLAYVAGAFVAIQVMEALSEPMGLSIFFQQAVLTLIFMGLPVALVLAWFHGEKGAQRVSPAEFMILIALGVVTVGALTIVWQRSREASAADPLPIAGAAPLSSDRLGSTESDVVGIAVLPFEELTPPTEALRLPDAVHDQVPSEVRHGPAPAGQHGGLGLEGRRVDGAVFLHLIVQGVRLPRVWSRP